MSIYNDLLILAVDDRIWIDSESLIAYLRGVEAQAGMFLKQAEQEADYQKAVAAYSVGDSVRQITDGLVLTALVAGDQIRSKRAAR